MLTVFDIDSKLTDTIEDESETVALTDGELRDLKSQFDDELDPLFEGITIDRENV